MQLKYHKWELYNRISKFIERLKQEYKDVYLSKKTIHQMFVDKNEEIEYNSFYVYFFKHFKETNKTRPETITDRKLRSLNCTNKIIHENESKIITYISF